MIERSTAPAGFTASETEEATPDGADEFSITIPAPVDERFFYRFDMSLR